MATYNLTEYSDIYLKGSESLWQYYRDEPALDSNNTEVTILALQVNIVLKNKNSISFKFKEKIIKQKGNYDIKDVKIMVALKYLSNFWRTLKTSLINCKISLMLTWSKKNFSRW